MTSQQLLGKIRNTEVQKIGKTPVVIVPIKIWEEIGDRLEDLEMEQSASFKKKITRARSEKTLYLFNPRTGIFKKSRKTE